MRARLPVLDLDDRTRRAVAYHIGKPGLATRSECVSVIRGGIEALLWDLLHELDQADEAEDIRAARLRGEDR